jgi:hypothetical protein
MLLPARLNVTDTGAGQSPQLVDAIGIERKLVKFSDPDIGACDLFADEAGGQSARDADSFAEGSQHRPGELLADSATDRERHGAVAVEGR